MIKKIKRQIKLLLLPPINYKKLFIEHGDIYDIKKINKHLQYNKMLTLSLTQTEKLHQSERAIIYAVFSQNLPLIKELLKKRVDINFANEYILRQLIKNNVSYNNWPLMKFCIEQSNNIYLNLEDLTNIAFKVNDEDFIIELAKKCLNKEKNKKESITSKVLKNSIEHRNFERFTKLIEIVDNNLIKENYNFLLKYALFFNNSDIIKKLLENKVQIEEKEKEEAKLVYISPLQSFDEKFFEQIPLIFVSAQYNSLEIFKEIELLTPIKEDDKEKVMIWAALNNSEEILHYLKNKNYSLEAKEYFLDFNKGIKLSPFIVAAKKDKLNILEYLIKNNALDNNVYEDFDVKKETKDYISKYNETYLLSQNMDTVLINKNKEIKRVKL